MSSNGGTLHGVPQPPGGHHNCSQCGLLFDSAASLQVHMHYHHEAINRCWPPGSSTIVPPPPSSLSNSSQSPTDSENNNQPPGKLSIQRSKSNASPQNNTIAAAADSSDNQPPTPTPHSGNNGEPGTPQSYSGTTSPYQQGIPPPPPSHQDMHYSYMHNYDQYYHQHNAMEYGVPPPHHLNNHHQQQLQQEYKPVPSSRYHPYMHNSSHQNSPSTTQSSLSPSVVSSSSPTTTTTTPLIPPLSQGHIPPGQPTPSPSPKQCDKCGMVCDSPGQLSEHYANAHPGFTSTNGGENHSNNNNSLNRSNNDENIDIEMLSNYGSGGGVQIKEEQPSDILDLDSQKMVYPPHHDSSNEGSLPPMNTMHGIHSMPRPPMSWHDPHHFMPPHHQTDLTKLGYYPQTMPSIKQEFPLSIKSEYNSHTLPPISNPEVKSFGSDVSTGNQVTTSPSDFPTTTTPQENGSQFRTFEASSSSLPNTPAQIKATTWKSNEARRPKTYNCTACNKWFTSSGHLKRHYNTTLHKNAVKSSGQPDPATLPISVHHHPSRDPNSKHNRKNAAQQQQQRQEPPAQPPDPPSRSPEYTPQYTPPSGFGPPQSSLSSGQGFQQYGTTLHSTTPGGPPNGQAGPSVHASQPRGLLIYSNNNMAQQQQQEVPHQEPIHTTTSIIIPPQQHHIQPQQYQALSPINTINSMGHYNIISPIAINTNITTTPSYLGTLHLAGDQLNYPPTIGSPDQMLVGGCDSSSAATVYNHMAHHQPHHMDTDYMESATADDNSQTMMIDDKTDIKGAVHSMMINRLSGGAAMYQGDTAPPFSPDIPEPYTSSSTNYYTNDGRAATPQMGETAPPSPSPCSPSITSTGGLISYQASSQTTTSEHSANQPQPSQMIVGKEPYRCDQCDKVFNKACYLTQHNKTFHCGEKPYKCQRCGKRFPCDQSHEEHFAKHAGEKPFKCELCPKQFNHKTDLRRHMCVHSGAKPYACEQCGKGFIRKDHMIKHTDIHRRKSITSSAKREKSQKSQNKTISSSSSPTPIYEDSKYENDGQNNNNNFTIIESTN